MVRFKIKTLRKRSSNASGDLTFEPSSDLNSDLADSIAFNNAASRTKSTTNAMSMMQRLNLAKRDIELKKQSSDLLHLPHIPKKGNV